jgi:putative endonuclease
MPGQRTYTVYILATRKDGPIYVGVTNDLARRMSEHKSGKIAGFTARYNVNRFVYHETYDDPNSAIAREKQLKRWPSLEGCTHRRAQSGLARPDGRHHGMTIPDLRFIASRCTASGMTLGRVHG